MITDFDPLRTLASCEKFGPMKNRASIKSWWQPLPVWLKGVTLLLGFPGWLFIAFSVLSGQAKSVEAFVAFAIFAAVTILNIIFDHHNRRGERKRSSLDVSGSGE